MGLPYLGLVFGVVYFVFFWRMAHIEDQRWPILWPALSAGVYMVTYFLWGWGWLANMMAQVAIVAVITGIRVLVSLRKTKT